MAKYTEPKISTANPKDWYVWFRYEGRSTPVKLREGINRIQDLSERKIAAEALRKARKLWLQDGWNPILDPEFKLQTVQNNTEKLKEMLFGEAMKFALSKKKLAKKSYQDYNNCLTRILKVGERTMHNYIPVADFERIHVMSLMSECSAEYKFSNHASNKYNDVVRALLGFLSDEWQIIKYNPASKIKRLKVAESNKYMDITPDEKEQIYAHLLKVKPLFLFYIQVLFYTGIRPKELLAIKIKDIYLDRRVIIIEPDLEEENSKTANVRYVAINDHLLSLLNELLAGDYPKDYYLFGSCYPAGGNRGSSKGGGSGAMHPDYFKPSQYMIKRDTVTKLWNKLIWDGLGIEKYLYALKATGANEMILSGITLDALKEMYGHTSKLTTEIYANKIKAIHRQEIINRAQPFLKVV